MSAPRVFISKGLSCVLFGRGAAKLLVTAQRADKSAMLKPSGGTGMTEGISSR
jgi:hypothetical protein